MKIVSCQTGLNSLKFEVQGEQVRQNPDKVVEANPRRLPLFTVAHAVALPETVLESKVYDPESDKIGDV
jgi:hypothetical protein